MSVMISSLAWGVIFFGGVVGGVFLVWGGVVGS